MSRLSLLRLVPLLAVFGLFALNYQLDYDFLLTKPRYTTSGLPYSPIKSGPFNPDLDWLVFVHIQKTSGSHFDTRMVQDLVVKYSDGWHDACVVKDYFKRYSRRRARGYMCKRRTMPNVSWYISWNEASIHWICGIHPAYWDMRTCLGNKYKEHSLDRFHFITMLRDPVKRFISEYFHVKLTGTMWIREEPPRSPDQFCLRGLIAKCSLKNKHWRDVTLEEFLTCPWNQAFNRETRMLAVYDSKFTMCDYVKQSAIENNPNMTELNEELLRRAILGLHSLKWFGLAEYQRESRRLLERMFDDRFKFKNEVNQKPTSVANDAQNVLSQSDMKRIKQLVHLDIRLYSYARDLFMRRLKEYKVVESFQNITTVNSTGLVEEN